MATASRPLRAPRASRRTWVGVGALLNGSHSKHQPPVTSSQVIQVPQGVWPPAQLLRVPAQIRL